MLILSDVYLIRTDARMVKTIFELHKPVVCQCITKINFVCKINVEGQYEQQHCLRQIEHRDTYLGEWTWDVVIAMHILFLRNELQSLPVAIHVFNYVAKKKNQSFANSTASSWIHVFSDRKHRQNKTFSKVYSRTQQRICFLRQAGPTLIEITPIDDKGLRRGECKWFFII